MFLSGKNISEKAQEDLNGERHSDPAMKQMDKTVTKIREPVCSDRQLTCRMIAEHSLDPKLVKMIVGCGTHHMNTYILSQS
jgi:hypothetical protein